MRCRRTWADAVLALLILCGCADGVSGATLSPRPCIGVPPVGLAPTELSGAITCPQFAGPGTLTGMSLSFTGWLDGTINWTNFTSVAQTGTFETWTRFTVGPVPGFALPVPLFTVVAATGPLQVAPGASVTASVSGSGGLTIVNAAVLPPYIGGDTFAIPVTTSTFLLANTGDKPTVGQSTHAALTASVTYEVEDTQAVPEPTSVILLATGSVSAMAARLRRASRLRIGGRSPRRERR